jgi:hypothetical protein
VWCVCCLPQASILLGHPAGDSSVVSAIAPLTRCHAPTRLQAAAQKILAVKHITSSFRPGALQVGHKRGGAATAGVHMSACGCTPCHATDSSDTTPHRTRRAWM